MRKKKNEALFSASISEFCKLINSASKDFAWHSEEESKMDMLTQDLLHALELNNLDYKERAKLATQLQHCRKQRRVHKDIATVLEPLVEFLESYRGKNLVNALNEAVGKMRKAEEKIAKRTYYPRIINPPAQSDKAGS